MLLAGKAVWDMYPIIHGQYTDIQLLDALYSLSAMEWPVGLDSPVAVISHPVTDNLTSISSAAHTESAVSGMVSLSPRTPDRNPCLCPEEIKASNDLSWPSS